jgi:hypothetical protein
MATKKITLNELRSLIKQVIKEENKASRFEYDVEDFQSNDWSGPEKGYLEDENKFDIDEGGDFYNTYDNLIVKNAKIILNKVHAVFNVEKVLEIPLKNVLIPKKQSGEYDDYGASVYIRIHNSNKNDYLTPEISSKIFRAIEKIKKEGKEYNLFLELNLSNDEIDKYINAFSTSYDDTQSQERRMGA